MGALCFVGPKLAQVTVANGAAVNSQRKGEGRCEYAEANQFNRVSWPYPPVVEEGEGPHYGADEYPDGPKPEKIIANAVSQAHCFDDLFFGHFFGLLRFCVRFLKGLGIALFGTESIFLAASWKR